MPIWLVQQSRYMQYALKTRANSWVQAYGPVHPRTSAALMATLQVRLLLLGTQCSGHHA